MEFINTTLNSLPLLVRVIIFIGFAVSIHLLVQMIRYSSTKFLSKESYRNQRKLQSITTLATSAIVFSLYFLAVGLILKELGVSLTAYLASASVVGLAVGFGSQGLVQDVVNGLTFIFSDLVDVGDLVEISGQTGIVKSITMRFVRLENAMGASVFIPNRTISNVINYPRGYVRYLVDVTLTGDKESRKKMMVVADQMVHSVVEVFPGIIMGHPGIGKKKELKSGKEFIRINFPVWPNRGDAIEKYFCPELIAALKQYDSEYQPWMIAVNYEIDDEFISKVPGLTW